MSIVIRPYEEGDFHEICSWWDEHKELAPLQGMMVSNGTFVLEYNGETVMTLTAFMTQSKQISYLEGFCAKPGLDKKERNKLSVLLFSWCIQYLREHDVKKTLILANNAKVAKRYEELGMVKCVSGLYALGKEL